MQVHPPTFHQEYRRKADSDPPVAPALAAAPEQANALKTESLLATT